MAEPEPSPPKRPKWKDPFVVAFVVGIVVLTALPFAQKKFLRAPPPILALPAWALSRPDGGIVSSASLSGKVVLIEFVEAGCDAACVDRLDTFGRGVTQTDDLQGAVAFLSVVLPGAESAAARVHGEAWVAGLGDEAQLAQLLGPLRAGWTTFAGTDAGATLADFSRFPGVVGGGGRPPQRAARVLARRRRGPRQFHQRGAIAGETPRSDAPLTPPGGNPGRVGLGCGRGPRSSVTSRLAMTVKTYTSMRTNPLEFLKDARTLWKIRTRDVDQQVQRAATIARRFDSEVKEQLGTNLEGKRVLIIGPGQTLREWWAFSSMGARVTGIDLDVVPVGLDLKAYLNLYRRNGPVRFAKTVGRKVLGIDRAFEKGLARELGVPKLRPGELIAADASKLPFSEGEFDVVFSFSVFEHLDAPDKVMKEVARVLRPGGFAHISTHLYASEGGCHDLRIFSGNREGIPLWAHLRPPVAHLVQEGCYMNKLRSADFERLFHEQWGAEVRFETETHHAAFDAELRAALPALRAAGELADYTDAELLAVNLIARWKKPARPN